MTQISKLVAQFRNNPKNVNFTDLIQEKKGKAKVYQVRQILEAIDKLERMNHD